MTGEIKAETETHGEPRADFDLLAAATPLAHRLVLATLNARHFDGIPCLQVQDRSV